MSRKLTPEEREARKAQLKAYKRQWYLANRERTLAVNQAYREKNPELIKRLKKRWEVENLEKVVRMARERRQANPNKRRVYEAEYRKRETSMIYQKRYYEQNKEAIKARGKEWWLANRDEINKRQRERIVKRWLKIAGWSQTEYERRLALGCEICGKKVARNGVSGLVFDHDHDTGLVRGLLCAKCNQRLDWAIEFYEQIGCYHRFSLEAAA